jgi:hypothetical protein
MHRHEPTVTVHSKYTPESSFRFDKLLFAKREISLITCITRGPLIVAQWLRYCATNPKVAGSIPDSVVGIFHWHNPSDRTVALGSTQPLTEEYQEHFLGVKAAGA